jgi:hypothetical protein
VFALDNQRHGPSGKRAEEKVVSDVSTPRHTTHSVCCGRRSTPNCVGQ